MKLHAAEIDLDCPHCRHLFEIAAVKFGFLRLPAMLFVCPGRGLTRADPTWTSRFGKIRLEIAQKDSSFLPPSSGDALNVGLFGGLRGRRH
jgi:hypothetical protein